MAKEKAMGSLRRASGAAVSYKAKNYLFVVAINDYEHIEKLNNCVSDAEAVIQLLTEDFEFEREEVCFICSGPLKPAFEDVTVLAPKDDGTIAPAKATRSVVLRELRRVAKLIEKDQEEDPKLKVNLLLYYSGHGWYDDFLDQGYWIPVDSELDDYSKYISNGTIQDFLNGIPTHHTLLLSDSCFSGSLFATGTGKSLASTRLEKDPSRWGITAGRNEVVSDGEAGEQSPFIKSFLTELRAADTIAVQDLSTKILERVASNDKQTPRGEPLRVRGHKGGQFVFRKKANARKHFDAGKLIMRLARHQPEYARFRAAASQFEMAGRLSKKQEDRREFLLWQARALSYAGLLTEAIDLLNKASGNLAGFKNASKLQELKQALNLLKAPAKMVKTLAKRTFTTEGNWCKKLAVLHKHKYPERKDCHLLQVAINEYEAPGMPRLSGCINDAEIIAEGLKSTFGEHRFQTKKLYDKEATRANIIQALKSLQENVGKEDLVFIHFPCLVLGQQKEEDSKERGYPFILPFDLIQDKATKTYQLAIGHRELHNFIEAIPSENIVVILDTDDNGAFRELAKEGRYTLLWGTQKGEFAKETKVDNNKTHGLFSYALYQVLIEQKRSSAQQKAARIQSIITKKVKDQHPVFIRAAFFFAYASDLSHDTQALTSYLFHLFYGPRNSQLPHVNSAFVDAIEQLELTFSAEQWQRLAEQLPPAASKTTSINYYEKSLSLYQEKEQAIPNTDILHIHLQLARLYASIGHLPKATEHFTNAYNHLSEKDKPTKDFITQKLSDLNRLAQKKKYALLINVDSAMAHSPMDGDLQAWKQVLMELGYEERNIITLQDAQATRSEIMRHFKKLAKKAATNPAFFFFIGKAIADIPEQDQEGALCVYDSVESDKNTLLLLSDLNQLSAATRHLTVVLDTKFNDSFSQSAEETGGWGKNLFGNMKLLPGIFDASSGGAVHQNQNETDGEEKKLNSFLLKRLQEGTSNNIATLCHVETKQPKMMKIKWLLEDEEEKKPLAPSQSNTR